MKNIIEFKGVKKKLGDKAVLDGLDLGIREGETFVLIGQSGVGKSVLLKHIIGILEPDEGEVVIDGKDYSRATEKEWTEIRREIGMLFQGGALFDSLTVGQNLLFALDHIRRELSERDKEVKVLTALKKVGLPGIEDAMPSELSGGMMKRVALARAIVTEPAIVLFDEPTTGLDPIMTANINELIMEVKEGQNTTFVVVTHDINSARTVADRIGMIYQGKLIFEGKAAELDTTDNPFVRQFVAGSSKGPITDMHREHLARLAEKHRIEELQAAQSRRGRR